MRIARVAAYGLIAVVTAMLGGACLAAGEQGGWFVASSCSFIVALVCEAAKLGEGRRS